MEELKEIIKDNTLTIDRLINTFKLHMDNLMDSSSKIEKFISSVDNMPKDIKIVLMEETKDMKKDIRAFTKAVDDLNENEKIKAKRKWILDLIKYILPFLTGIFGFLAKDLIK